MTRLLRRHSAHAVWSRRLGIFAVPLTVLTVLIHRFTDLDTKTALAALAIAFVLGLMALIFAIAGIGTIWARGYSGFRSAVVGWLLGVLVLAAPGYALNRMVNHPRIHDVTTDWIDPPILFEAERLRPEGANDAGYPGEEHAELQQEAHPEIGPLFLEIPRDEVYAAAQALVTERGWQIISAEAPEAELQGRLAAVARTRIMGLREDVVITVSDIGGASRIDMRSASRWFAHDFGSNAERIYTYLTDLSDRLDPDLATAPEAEPES